MDARHGKSSAPEAIRHIAAFTSGIWQIHPFGEGNTRATAVFIVKYLKTFGFAVNNDVFAENSWYFRNALVRANYNDLQHGIHATNEFLERFFENLLLDAKHELKTVIFMWTTKSRQNPKVHQQLLQSAIFALWRSWRSSARLQRSRRLRRRSWHPLSASQRGRSKAERSSCRRRDSFAGKAASETAVGIKRRGKGDRVGFFLVTAAKILRRPRVRPRRFSYRFQRYGISDCRNRKSDH